MLGPAFYFLFYLLPGEFAEGQALAESGLLPGTLERLNGVAARVHRAALLLSGALGHSRDFFLPHPWRILLFVLVFLLSLLGGFRGNVILMVLLFLCLFCVEGLWRTRFLPVLLGVGLAAGVLLLAFSDHLPRAAQRAVCFLPVKVDPSVRADADFSVEWRLRMWRYLVPQIPKYLLLGKGYRIDPDELYFATLRGGDEDIQAAPSLVAGDYHNGPLSTIIPLGLWGLLGFLWLLGAGFKVLYRNFRYGDPALRGVNAFFLSYFIMQGIFFFTIFGAFDTQLFLFTGILGLSVSLNGGVRKKGRVLASPVAAVASPAPVAVPA